MIFCSKFIQELFTKMFEAPTLFWKLSNKYPNTTIFLVLQFFNEISITKIELQFYVNNLFPTFEKCLLKSFLNKNLKLE